MELYILLQQESTIKLYGKYKINYKSSYVILEFLILIYIAFSNKNGAITLSR